MSILLEPKRADEVRRYRHDWEPFLGADTISSQTTTAVGATVDSSSIEDGDQSILFTLSGGTDGTVATITQSITTAAGDEEIEVFILQIGADEPVSLTDAKRQCRMVDDDSEDSFICSLIAPARAYVERAMRRLFVSGPRTETFTRWGDHLEIWRYPIASIDSVTYSTTDDPLDDAAYTGFVANLGFPARISPADGDDFPDLLAGGTITVAYTGGALAATSEEFLIGKRAMLLLIGFWFENRGEVPLDKDTQLALEFILDDMRPVSAY